MTCRAPRPGASRCVQVRPGCPGWLSRLVIQVGVQVSRWGCPTCDFVKLWFSCVVAVFRLFRLLLLSAQTERKRLLPELPSHQPTRNHMHPRKRQRQPRVRHHTAACQAGQVWTGLDDIIFHNISIPNISRFFSQPATFGAVSYTFRYGFSAHASAIGWEEAPHARSSKTPIRTQNRPCSSASKHHTRAHPESCRASGSRRLTPSLLTPSLLTHPFLALIWSASVCRRVSVSPANVKVCWSLRGHFISLIRC